MIKPFQVFALLSAGLALSSCNSNDSQPQSVANDWIQHPPAAVPVVPAPNPTPTPTATASPAPVSDLYDGPAEVAPFVQKFVDDAAVQGRTVTGDMKNPKLVIQIASLSAYGSSVIGLCETGGNLRRVTFSPSFWNAVDDTQRELLAHHELGHCVLNRAHRNDVLATGKPASIMYPVIFSNSTYQSDYAYYQNELFTQAELAPGTDPNVAQTYVCDQNELLNTH